MDAYEVLIKRRTNRRTSHFARRTRGKAAPWAIVEVLMPARRPGVHPRAAGDRCWRRGAQGPCALAPTRAEAKDWTR